MSEALIGASAIIYLLGLALFLYVGIARNPCRRSIAIIISLLWPVAVIAATISDVWKRRRG